LEIRDDIVREGVREQLVEPEEIRAGDFRELLTTDVETTWDDILFLAPEGLSLQKLWAVVRRHLVVGGHLVIVPQESDLLEVSPEVNAGVALEGTMHWYTLTIGSVTFLSGCYQVEKVFASKRHFAMSVLLTCPFA
jgi:hypothetical protein